jgi:hypothetical protein
MTNEKETKGKVVLGNSERKHLVNTGDGAGSFVRQAVENLDEESKRELSTYAGKKLIDLETKRHEQEADLNASTRDIENHIDAFNMLNKDGKLTRQKITSDLKSGAGNMKLESKSGASCFVATVCYGDAHHPDLDTLRKFRDERLSKSALGAKIVEWYYNNGAELASFVDRRKLLKTITHSGIKLLVKMIKVKY